MSRIIAAPRPFIASDTPALSTEHTTADIDYPAGAARYTEHDNASFASNSASRIAPFAAGFEIAFAAGGEAIIRAGGPGINTEGSTHIKFDQFIFRGIAASPDRSGDAPGADPVIESGQNAHRQIIGNSVRSR